MRELSEHGVKIDLDVTDDVTGKVKLGTGQVKVDYCFFFGVTMRPAALEITGGGGEGQNLTQRKPPARKNVKTSRPNNFTHSETSLYRTTLSQINNERQVSIQK